LRGETGHRGQFRNALFDHDLAYDILVRHQRKTGMGAAIGNRRGAFPNGR